MNQDIQQLQKEIDGLTAKVDNLYQSSSIDRNIETAFRERLNPPTIYTGIVAPATTPTQIGSIFINTVLAKVYMATGLTSSSDWKVLN